MEGSKGRGRESLLDNERYGYEGHVVCFVSNERERECGEADGVMKRG